MIYPADSPRAGEIIVECSQKITKNIAETICTSGIKKIEVMEDPRNPLLLNALADDNTASHEEALLRIYQRLRPATRPSWKRQKLCSMRSSSTRTAIGWGESDAFASTASWA